MRAFTDNELIVRIMALDEEDNVDGWIKKWDPLVDAWETAEHIGDCTGHAFSCSRCWYDETKKRVADFRRVLDLPTPPQGDEE